MGYTACVYRTVETKFERTDVWREGKWLDLWSVVHFLSGISLAPILSFLHFGAFASTLFALLLLVSYEMWEALVNIEEAPTNRVMDVVVGMTSFLLTFFVLLPLMSPTTHTFLFGLVMAVNSLLSISGWRASKKATTLQKRLLVTYARERAKLLEQRTRLRKRFQR